LLLEIVLFEAGDFADPGVIGMTGKTSTKRLVIEDDPGGMEARLAGQSFDFGGQRDDFEIVLIAVDQRLELRVLAVVVP
jgi:hypothetical protein